MSDRQPNTTIRVNREHGYVAMPRDPAMDHGLSNKALGLLYRILQFPDNWNLSVAGLVEICPDGKAAIMSGLKELEAHGYLVRRRIRDDKGVFLRMEYIIYEHPQAPAPEAPSSENQTMDTAEECAQPLSDFPALENPEQGNPPQIKNIINNNPPTPQGEAGEAAPKRRKVAYTPEFERFWAAYPKCDSKRDKEDAFRAWQKQAIQPADMDAILRGLEWDKQSDRWHRDNGQYIPYPVRWIRRRRWESATPPADDRPIYAAAAGDTLPAAPEDWL